MGSGWRVPLFGSSVAVASGTRRAGVPWRKKVLRLIRGGRALQLSCLTSAEIWLLVSLSAKVCLLPGAISVVSLSRIFVLAPISNLLLSFAPPSEELRRAPVACQSAQAAFSERDLTRPPSCSPSLSMDAVKVSSLRVVESSSRFTDPISP